MLASAAGGDGHRRTNLADAPLELMRIGHGVDDLLDGGRHEEVDTRSLAAFDRALLLHYIDHDPTPIVVVDPEGRIHVANRAANDLLGGPDSGLLRGSLGNVATGGRPDGWSITSIGRLRLCRKDGSSALQSRIPASS